MRIILCTAVAKEMQYVLKGLEAAGVLTQSVVDCALPQLRQHVLTPVELSSTDRELELLLTGVGPLNSAFALAQALPGAKSNATAPAVGVVNLGIAGSFDLDRLPLGEIVTVDEEIWPEYGVAMDDGVDPRILNFPLFQSEHGDIWERLELTPGQSAEQMGLTLDAAWSSGAGLTVAAATGTQTKAAHYAQKHSPVLENMEGFGLAYACRLLGVPFLEARTISNLVGAREKEFWDMKKAFQSLKRLSQTLFTPLAGDKTD